MNLTLPPYELYEQDSRIRRSGKSIKDNIVEDYGRRQYNDFIKFLLPQAHTMRPLINLK